MDGFDTQFCLFLDFFKVSPNNKILTNQQFELSSIDGKGTGFFTNISDYGTYNINWYDNTSSESTLSFVENVLPDFVIDELSTVHTRDDLNKFNAYGSNFNIYGNDYSTNISFVLPVRLKQTITEEGYKKKDIVVLAEVEVVYYYDDSNNIYRKSLEFEIWNSEIGMMYNNEIGDLKTMNDLNNFISDDLEDACLNSANGRIITNYRRCTESNMLFSSEYFMVPYFIDEEGTVKLEITNTVNNLAKYNASDNKKLEYKICVKNTGDISSTNNVIVSYVPKGIEVDLKSISNSGTYNKSDNTITWNIDLIEEGKEIELSYKAMAPSTANGNELIGKSSVISDQVKTKVYSNDTIVTLDKIVEIIKNPKTGTSMIYIPNTNIGLPLNIFLVILASLIILGMFIVKKFKFKKRIG